MSWLDEMPERTPALIAKRTFDVLVAGAGLLVCSPLLAGVTVLGLAAHGWPPLFEQRRPGLHGKLFRMVKLRTMTNARGAGGALLSDAERLTTVGRVLRSTSLDELPELWNVLRGDMSLVGPRPLLVEYLERYSPQQMRRHEMPPGITGLAQVRGRNALDWESKFALDVEYVDRWSLWLDLEILVRTARTVVLREGISAAGDATMPVFMGEEPVRA